MMKQGPYEAEPPKHLHCGPKCCQATKEVGQIKREVGGRGDGKLLFTGACGRTGVKQMPDTVLDGLGGKGTMSKCY